MVLAKALRPPPEKHHGLSDVETRLRRRELDLIANEPTRRLFIDRARIISAVRSYLDENGFVEVETPVLQPLYGGALARPFTTHHNALDRDLYLRIATELYLKRLLVGGLERVYELGKDFRNEGLSTKHNPEFTMVEWYEAYADYRSEAERLQEIVRRGRRRRRLRGRARLRLPVAAGHASSRPIAEATGIELGADREASALAELIRARGLEVKVEGASWGQMADDLLSKYVEPTLQQPTFVFDYPVELSPFARAHREQPGLVERWEAFAGRDGDRQRLQRAHRPRHPARALRGPAAPAGAGRGGVPALRRGLRGGARAGNAARRGRGPRDRPPGDAADGSGLDPRGRPVSRITRLKGPHYAADSGLRAVKRTRRDADEPDKSGEAGW